MRLERIVHGGERGGVTVLNMKENAKVENAPQMISPEIDSILSSSRILRPFRPILSQTLEYGQSRIQVELTRKVP